MFMLLTVMSHAQPIACARQVPQPTVVVAASPSYLPSLLNWVLFYQAAQGNISLLHILCFGEGMDERLDLVGLECSSTLPRIEARATTAQLWKERVNLTQSLLESGHDVLLSDIDAIWVRSPLAVLQKHCASAVVAGRATFPQELSKRTGATVCFGFVFFRSLQSTKALLRELVHRMARTAEADDQRLFNFIVFESGLQFPRPLIYRPSRTSDTGSLTIEGLPAKLTLLAHDQVPRHCSNDELKDAVIVAHCMHSRRGKLKEVAARRAGLWVLRGDWANVRAASFVEAAINLREQLASKTKGTQMTKGS